MVKLVDLKQAVIAAKKEEFEFEAVSCSKRHFPGVKGYSIRDFLCLHLGNPRQMLFPCRFERRHPPQCSGIYRCPV